MKARSKILLYIICWLVLGYTFIVMGSLFNKPVFFLMLAITIVALQISLWSIRCPKCGRPISGINGLSLRHFRHAIYRSYSLKYKNIRGKIGKLRCRNCGFDLKEEV